MALYSNLPSGGTTATRRTTKITTSIISAPANQTATVCNVTGKGVAHMSYYTQGGNNPMICVIDGETLPTFEAACGPVVDGSSYMLRDIRFNKSLKVTVTPSMTDAVIRLQVNFEE